MIYSWNAFTARCDYGQPCFEQKKLTFGQGKSLSLICGSLTWLRDFQEKALEQNKGLDEGGISPKHTRQSVLMCHLCRRAGLGARA